MSLFDRKAMLIEATAAAIAAGGISGCAPEPELGAFGGVADIPGRVWGMQQWSGFAVQPTPAQGTPLLRLQLGLQYARDWTIQLAAPQVPPGAALAVASTNAATVRLRWGHHGSTDEVLFSWPDRGGAITVHGCFVELSVIDTTVAATPTARYNAWLTEGAGARGALAPFQPIHSVIVSQSLAPAGAALVILSPRTRAFYLTAVPANFLAGAPIEMRLQDNLVTRAVYEIDPGTGGAGHDLLDFSREAFPVPPWVNAVLFNNTSADIWDALTIHQLLDLGG